MDVVVLPLITDEDVVVKLPLELKVTLKHALFVVAGQTKVCM